MILCDKNNFGAIFFALSHLFYFVYISSCVTHDVRRAFQFSLYASVLICRAETLFLLTEVTVVSCSITGFCTCNMPGSIFGG